MKRSTYVLTVLCLILSSILSSSDSVDAAMIDYCQVPPYVIQDVPPNVMIVIDNSGSMFRFAYYDGFTTSTDSGDDNMCDSSSSPCTEFTEPGTYPTYTYYGYFNSDYWYTYSSNRFIPAAPKTGSGLSGARAKNAAEWDGNFLNWVTMRRLDIIRKVMTGGKTESGEGASYNRLTAETADCDSRGMYKSIANIQNYVDGTLFSGTRCVRVMTAGGSCDGGDPAHLLLISHQVQVAVPLAVTTM